MRGCLRTTDPEKRPSCFHYSPNRHTQLHSDDPRTAHMCHAYHIIDLLQVPAAAWF